MGRHRPGDRRLSRKLPYDDSEDWLCLVGIIAVAIKSGSLWGAAVGWLILGALCIFVAIVSAIVNRRS